MHICCVLHDPAATMTFQTLAQHCKPFIPLLAAPAALLLSQGQAKAVLTYNIFESAGNVVVQTSGSLNLTGATIERNVTCGADGAIIASLPLLCTGPNGTYPAYTITGPSSLAGTAAAVASRASGITTLLQGNKSRFSIDNAYVSNTPIISNATFDSSTLAGFGFTTTGLIGTWTLVGTSETIRVMIGSPETGDGTAAVPGPLPLLGAGAAFGWSRRLRNRIATTLITQPQA
jgi:MYXO-CTERM domain-containing protein